MPEPLVYLLVFFVILLLIALLFWPDKGLISLLSKRSLRSKHQKIENVLKTIQHCEFHSHPATLHHIAGILDESPDEISHLLDRMVELELIQIKGNEISLTSKGFDYAIHMTRAHRLWEEFLAQETSLPIEEIHQRANDIEHNMSPESLDALSMRLGNPSFDIHGDPIPTAQGRIRQMKGKSLTELPAKQTLRITHLEDEPEDVYAQLVAEGLYPGMTIYLVEESSSKIRFWSKYGEHVLTPVIASNISAIPTHDVIVPQEKTVMSLSELGLGETAKVKNLSPYLRKVERRRLMDLGFVPSTVVEANLKGTHGDPTAYRIRGTVIALREDQTRLIEIEPLKRSQKEEFNGKF
jgi:DtxR family transcriptional regulator, Mn-dependent transcriptional regulator